MNILLNIVLVIFVLVSLLMILIILMQRPKSEGLGAAFGGGVTENLFGAQTTNVLTKITGWLAGLFFALTFLLSILYAQRSTATSGLRQQLMKSDANGAAAPAAPSPAVGAPNTVTNPTPGMAEGGATPEGSAAPADQAVGLTAPAISAPPVESPAGSPPPKP
jgi:preprotein translocase subunit SecG